MISPFLCPMLSRKIRHIVHGLAFGIGQFLKHGGWAIAFMQISVAAACGTRFYFIWSAPIWLYANSGRASVSSRVVLERGQGPSLCRAGARGFRRLCEAERVQAGVVRA
jgi:hypothetical protein